MRNYLVDLAHYYRKEKISSHSRWSPWRSCKNLWPLFRQRLIILCPALRVASWNASTVPPMSRAGTLHRQLRRHWFIECQRMKPKSLNSGMHLAHVIILYTFTNSRILAFRKDSASNRWAKVTLMKSMPFIHSVALVRWNISENSKNSIWTLASSMPTTSYSCGVCTTSRAYCMHCKRKIRHDDVVLRQFWWKPCQRNWQRLEMIR